MDWIRCALLFLCSIKICYTQTVAQGAVRLVNGSTVNEGRVEIYLNGSWGTVCDDGWSNINARVVCRQLDFMALGATFFFGARFGRGTDPILLDDVRCAGSELRLIDCPARATGHNCNHGEDVGVRCLPNGAYDPPTGNLRLSDGANNYEGRLEIFVNGTWGTVCDDSFNTVDAQVACRQLGFQTSNVRVLSPLLVGGGTGQIWLDEVACTGFETRLIECDHSALGVHDCSHLEDVRIGCDPSEVTVPIRLAGGADNSSGRVEVYINGTWGTVCDDLWDNLDAMVVCRQLNFQTAGAVALTSGFTNGAGRIWLDNVQCIGTEASLLNCTHGGLGIHNCGHTEDAGVNCQQGCVQNELRLRGGANSSTGRVEICNNNIWGTVCDDGWGTPDAQVVCRQLGLPTSGAVPLTSGFIVGAGQIWLDDVLCIGTESRLADCPARPLGQHNCAHVEDAGVTCLASQTTTAPPPEACTDGTLRLVGGTSELEGRVEVCNGQVWGTVCDDLWDNVDAGVACAQLGYSSGGAIAFSFAHFGQGTGPIVLDNLQCTGSETRLVDCEHNGLGIENCAHAEDAGLRCTVCVDGTLRLMGGSTELEGRVEVCHNGEFGTVCDDSWGISDARVVCRQLGLSPEGAQALFSGFIKGAGQIWLDDVRCVGTETRLVDCPARALGTHNCGHIEDAGVRCMPLVTTQSPPACVDGTLRLMGGSTELEGRVEVCNNGEFGTVCDDSWSTSDARVVCRQLGLSPEGALALYSGFTNGAGQIWLDDVRCVGTEARLVDCPARPLGQHNCGHIEDAGVRCMPSITTQSPPDIPNGRLRLVDGTTNYSGRVEIFINGIWGTVCDDFWDRMDAMVVCRQLNFSTIDVVAVSHSMYGSGTGPILLDDVSCTGSEPRLLDCPHDGLGTHNCFSTEIAGVMCSPGPNQPRVCEEGEVRLVNGTATNEGRVEACIGNMWGTVCDDLWGENEAMVICRQLDLPTSNVTALGSAFFGRGTLPIVLDQVSCRGTELSITQCSYTRNHDCTHFEDVGVRCLAATPPPPGSREGDIRLVGGNTVLEGRVEVFTQDAAWATVCDDGWGQQEAMVVCRQLGYPTEGAEAFGNARYGAGLVSQPILLDDVSCAGEERRLVDCDHRGLNTHNCGHQEDASVRCLQPPVPGPPVNVRARLLVSDCSRVVVTWSPPPDYQYTSLITEYRVSVTTLVQGGTTMAVTALTNRTVINNLPCDTAFFVTVSTFAFSFSAPSNVSHFVTNSMFSTEESRVATGATRTSFAWVAVFPVLLVAVVALVALIVAVLFFQRRRKRRELFIGSDDNLVHVQANKFADDSMQVNISTKAAPNIGSWHPQPPRYELTTTSKHDEYVTDT